MKLVNRCTIYRSTIYKYALTNLNLRSDKSTNSNVISVIPKNSKLEVIDEDDEWLKVKYDSREGYVYNDINLITTDLKNKYTYIFRKDNGRWVNLYKYRSTVGKSSFGTNEYQVKYVTRIKDGYYYHSILYDSTGSYIIDGRLGMALSHGCIRLDTDNAKWIYENIPDNTTVIIH